MGLVYDSCGVSDGFINLAELRVFYGTENVVLNTVEGGAGGNRIKWRTEWSGGSDSATVFDGNPVSYFHSGAGSGGELPCLSLPLTRLSQKPQAPAIWLWPARR